jgi:hypothetical protein
MNTKNSIKTKYSIQDAFKSLSMLEDEEVLIIEEEQKKPQILSESSKETSSVKEQIVDVEETENVDTEKDLDSEIENFTKNLRKLKEKYDKNSSSLTEEEIKQLKEAGILEQAVEVIADENIVTEANKIKVTDKKKVEQELENREEEKQEEEVEMVVDVEVDKVEDLKDSYVGNFILQCSVCHTLVYKEPELVVSGEEDEELVNVEEACPHCKAEEGFIIVGKVASIKDEEQEESEDEATSEDENQSEDEEENTEEIEDEEMKNELETPSIELDDLNEELFNRLATKYLNNIYENVENFTTQDGEVEEDTNRVTLEGTINFKSGKKVNTKFVFEAKSLTKKGRVRFVGMNESLSSSKKTFTLVGRIIDKVLMSESLTYNYSVKVNEEFKRVYGRVTEDLAQFKK